MKVVEWWWNWKQHWEALQRQVVVTHFISGYLNSTNLLIKSLWFESTFRSWLTYITFSASHIALEFLCLNTLLARPGMRVYAGKTPRDGPFVYQRCLAQARVIEGRTPNIGLSLSPICHLDHNLHHITWHYSLGQSWRWLYCHRWSRGSGWKWGTVWDLWGWDRRQDPAMSARERVHSRLLDPQVPVRGHLARFVDESSRRKVYTGNVL